MKRRKKGIAALLLALCVTLGLLPALTVTAGVAGVSYLDASGATQTAASATSVTADDTAWNAGWYVVDSNVTNSNRITVTGDVHLILVDGKTLTASAGINVADGNSLSIYGQTNGTGTLNATGQGEQAGIGGGTGESGGETGGVITINGGTVTATAGNEGSAGIGGGGAYSDPRKGGDNGTITINGGTVTATGYNPEYGTGGGAAIGGGSGVYGSGGHGGVITINGGIVMATVTGGGAAIGGGYGNQGGNGDGTGIGGDGGTIAINGGTVTATAGVSMGGDAPDGVCIGRGGGYSSAGADASVTIGAGATVEAGTSSDGTGAAVVTDVANNTSYKYAKITFASAAPLDPVSYLDWDATNKELVEKTGDDACKDYALVTASTTAWGAANETKWYVVNSDVTIASRITVTGDVRLILKDGAELTASKGITVTGANSLTIYAQSEGESMGKLTATGDGGAGIGSVNGDGSGGAITINGGTVTATGSSAGAGIGGGCDGSGGTITINSGTVTATGGVIGAGIGGGECGAGGTITVNGGTVTATGGASGAGIGGGTEGSGGAITVNGGAVTANGGAHSAGIGGGAEGAGGTITVNGGAVTANGKKGGAGIGGGESGASGAISITGGTVNANGNVGGEATSGGAGIGGGHDGDNSGDGNSISITGGTVTATVLNGTLGAAIGNGGGSGTDVTVTIGVGLTVGAGTSADGTGATAVTDVANNASYKYAKITVAASASAPSYTIAAADTTTETDKKYHYGDEFTIAVTVSGADFEGGEFTLKYDSATLEVKTYPTGNKFADSVQTAGSVQFELLNKAKLTDGDALATITFKVKTPVTTETECKFEFSTDNPPKICYDTDKDSVEAATVTDGSVIVEPVTYAVTLTGADGVTFVNSSNETITTDTAVDGQAFTAQMGAEFDAANYVYTVTLKIGGAEVTPAPTPDSDGKITIPAEKVTIADAATDKTIVLTVGRTLGNFTVTTTADYVTGWTLVTIAKAEGRTDNPVYNYDGNAAYYVEAYNAYAYLVEGAVTVDDAKTKVSLGTSAAGTIAAGYDVNNTGKVDYSDALLTYRCYVKAYQTPATAMETYLRADVDNNKKVDTTDVSAIDENRTPET